MINHQKKKKKMIVYSWPQYVIWHDWANENKATIHCLYISENKNWKKCKIVPIGMGPETAILLGKKTNKTPDRWILKFHLKILSFITRKFALQLDWMQNEAMVIGIFIQFFFNNRRSFCCCSKQKFTWTINICYTSSWRRVKINSMFHIFWLQRYGVKCD